MAKNLKGKSRPKENPYEDLTDPRTGWRFRVLKHYKSTEAELADPYAYVDTFVDGFESEQGDTYIKDIYGLRELLEAEVAAKG